MRSFVRTLLVCAGCIGASLGTASWAASPVQVNLSILGLFDAGTSQATAENTPAISLLNKETASIQYIASDVSVLLHPGETQIVSLGNLTTATASLDAIKFDGAALNLMVRLDNPDGQPSFQIMPADVSGTVDDFGGAVTLVFQPPNEVEFTTVDCVPKTIRVHVEPTIRVVSGFFESDIEASVSLEYLVPFLPGDVDGDGLITKLDVLRAMMIAGGIDEGLCEEIERGDVSGNGLLDLPDTVSIVRLSNGLT